MFYFTGSIPRIANGRPDHGHLSRAHGHRSREGHHQAADVYRIRGRVAAGQCQQ